MSATYPTTVKQFANSNHIDGVDIAGHINDLQDEVKAIETSIISGTLAANNITCDDFTATGEVNLGGTNVDYLSIDEVAVTATAAELNLNDFGAQSLTASGAITAKNGVVLLAKTDGAVDATLAKPTAGDDNFKRLTIISTSAYAHTVTAADGFGNGSTGEDVATYGAQVGNSLELLAYGGFWYIVGLHQVTIA